MRKTKLATMIQSDLLGSGELRLAQLMEDHNRDYHRQFHEELSRNFHFRLCSRIIWLLDIICRGDFYNYQEDREAGDQASRGESSRRRRALLVCSKVLLIYYLIVSLGMLCSTYQQYRFDYYVLHLRRLKSAQGPDGESQQAETYEGANITTEALEERIQLVKLDVKLFGSPLLHSTYLAECTYTLMFSLAFLSYLGPILYFHTNGAFDYHFIRMMLDWADEQRRCNRMIEREVMTFIRSSEMFARNSLQLKLSNNLGLQLETVKRIVKLRERRKRVRLREHRQAVEDLTRMALANELQPFNRSDQAWLRSLTLYYSSLTIGSISFCFTWNILLFTFLPHLTGLHYENSPMDLWAGLELGSLNVILTIAAFFYISLSTINCMNQIRNVRIIRHLVDAFIDQGDRYRRKLNRNPMAGPLEPMARVDANQARDWSRLVDEGRRGGGEAEAHLSSPWAEEASAWRDEDGEVRDMNASLLRILLHYKIFVAQQKPNRHAFGFISVSSVGLMLLFPILARLHLPYISSLLVRYLSVWVCFLMTVFADCCLLPVCSMHSRCLDLYNSLSCLMAHLVDFSNDPNASHIYNQHTVWLLRKELAHPEKLADQFAIGSMGLVFNYSQLLKIHFWLGLVVLSLCSDLSSNLSDSIFRGLLSDPLDIFERPSL